MHVSLGRCAFLEWQLHRNSNLTRCWTTDEVPWSFHQLFGPWSTLIVGWRYRKSDSIVPEALLLWDEVTGRVVGLSLKHFDCGMKWPEDWRLDYPWSTLIVGWSDRKIEGWITPEALIVLWGEVIGRLKLGLPLKHWILWGEVIGRLFDLPLKHLVFVWQLVNIQVGVFWSI